MMVLSERKQQILESCKAAFAEKGFYGSSTKELANAAKISESLLYKHFPTKEILFRATLEEAISPYMKVRGTARCAPTKGQTNFLRNIAQSVLRPDEQTFRLLIFAYLELDKKYLTDFLKRFENDTKNLFKQNRDFEKIFTACLTGLNLLYPHKKTELVDEIAHLMLHGLLKQ